MKIKNGYSWLEAIDPNCTPGICDCGKLATESLESPTACLQGLVPRSGHPETPSTGKTPKSGGHGQGATAPHTR